MSVDTIMGIPFIHELAMELRLIPKRQFLAHGIKTSFPGMYKETVLTHFESPVDATASLIRPVTTKPPSTMGDPLRSFYSRLHPMDPHFHLRFDNYMKEVVGHALLP